MIILESQLRSVICVGCLLDGSLARCVRHVPPGGDPEKTQDMLEGLHLSDGLGSP